VTKHVSPLIPSSSPEIEDVTVSSNLLAFRDGDELSLVVVGYRF
jgi:hypothetical protein